MGKPRVLGIAVVISGLISGTWVSAEELPRTREAYSQRVRWVAAKVKDGEISACSAATYLMAQLAALNPDSTAFLREALVVFGDVTAVRSQLTRLEGIIRRLPVDAACASDPPLMPAPARAEWTNLRKAATLWDDANGAWPAWLSRHGDSMSFEDSQGWRRGYAQRDFDATGRHDHFLFHAYLQTTFRRLRGCTRFPLPLEPLLRVVEENKEDSDASSFFAKNGTRFLADPGYLAGYPASEQASVRARIESFLELKPRVSAETDPRRRQRLEKELGQLTRSLASDMDVEINRRGRAFAEQLAAGKVGDLGGALFEALCEEGRGLQAGFYRSAGPLR